MEQSADDNYEFDVNSRKFSKLVENTVGKGEIARYEQFFPFSTVFSKGLFAKGVKSVIVWEWVNSLPYDNFWLNHICLFGVLCCINGISVIYCDSSQIHVSWTIFNQYLNSPYPETGRLASRNAIPIILSAKGESHYYQF